MRTFFSSIRGGFSLLLLSLNSIFWTFPLLLVHLLKLLLPVRGWRVFWSRAQHGIGALWIGFNNLNLKVLNPVQWDVEGVEDIAPDQWYIVVANHRTWVDILVLQKIFNGKIPFLKFLLKRELFWVPFLGLAWWSLDYPFLERSSRPEKDLETIRNAAEKFKVIPVSIMNFVEGTRLTPQKQEKLRSPYRHLLKPKAGGLTFILTAMGDHVSTILDVTIAYPTGTPQLWAFLCGEVREIKVRVRAIPVEESLLGDYAGDKSFRREFTRWLGAVWAEKDEGLAALLATNPIVPDSSDPPDPPDPQNPGMV